MGNINAKDMHSAREQAHSGRRPDDQELILLYKIQKKLFTRLVECPYHIELLERYWESMVGSNNITFERISCQWKEIGFSSENPGDDIRATGELGLECLVFFVENYTAESRMMNRKFGYPFVQAGIAIARILMEIFHVIELDGTRGRFPVQNSLYWQLLDHEIQYYQLYSFCFLMFDELYCDWASYDKHFQQQVCTRTILTRVADIGKDKLMKALAMAPMYLSELTSLCTNGNILLKPKDKLTFKFQDGNHLHQAKNNAANASSNWTGIRFTESNPFQTKTSMTMNSNNNGNNNNNNNDNNNNIEDTRGEEECANGLYTIPMDSNNDNQVHGITHYTATTPLTFSGGLFHGLEQR